MSIMFAIPEHWTGVQWPYYSNVSLEFISIRFENENGTNLENVEIFPLSLCVCEFYYGNE